MSAKAGIFQVLFLLLLGGVIFVVLHLLQVATDTVAPPLRDSDYETVVVMDKTDQVQAGQNMSIEYLSDHTRFVGFDGNSVIFESIYPSRYSDEVHTTALTYKKGNQMKVPTFDSDLEISFVDRKGDTLYFRVVKEERQVKDTVHREPFKVIREGEDSDAK